MMKIRTMLAFAALLALCFVPSAVQAQQGQGGRGGFGRGGFGGRGGGFGAAMLVNLPKVQEELKITPEQKEKISTLQTEMRESARSGFDFQALRGLAQEERQAKMAEVREKVEKVTAEYTKKIEAELTAEQKNRLQEILIQLQGIGALSDEKVAALLVLTDDQKAKIAAAQTAYAEKRRGLFRNAGGGAAGGGRERFQEMQKAHEAEVLAILTKEQKEEFDAMKGAEFKVERAELFPRPAGGRPGADRPGRGGNRRPDQENN